MLRIILRLLGTFVAVHLADEANGDQFVDVNNLSSDLKSDLGSDAEDFQKLRNRFHSREPCPHAENPV
ncbi:unnamed protein product, partial [Mesorhabditis belari]|uniref:Uncharacterized protein n=1 Tax=Mesorhabditis belari TaxID=2138241 RepID=A0AAF3FBE6_9BILA